ncbi:hypothetical protein DL546_001426 [Coniochaeta pulveracea]|uniref:Uncharacterized protein n=1 Tax=Coniochaeta pulveracea TaxID=177199 RepID=A0A420Y3B6_9PEZI|nr:hypothetical protein DL546_001426 [Coniochaeta pulveracea]
MKQIPIHAPMVDFIFVSSHPMTAQKLSGSGLFASCESTRRRFTYLTLHLFTGVTHSLCFPALHAQQVAGLCSNLQVALAEKPPHKPRVLNYYQNDVTRSSLLTSWLLM